MPKYPCIVDDGIPDDCSSDEDLHNIPTFHPPKKLHRKARAVKATLPIPTVLEPRQLASTEATAVQDQETIDEVLEDYEGIKRPTLTRKRGWGCKHHHLPWCHDKDGEGEGDDEGEGDGEGDDDDDDNEGDEAKPTASATATSKPDLKTISSRTLHPRSLPAIARRSPKHGKCKGKDEDEHKWCHLSHHLPGCHKGDCDDDDDEPKPTESPEPVPALGDISRRAVEENACWDVMGRLGNDCNPVVVGRSLPMPVIVQARGTELGVGAVVGIVFGAFVAVGVLGWLSWMLLKAKMRRSDRMAEERRVVDMDMQKVLDLEEMDGESVVGGESKKEKGLRNL